MCLKLIATDTGSQKVLRDRLAHRWFWSFQGSMDKQNKV